MVEPEVAFMDLDGDMELTEEFVSSVVGQACSRSTRRSWRPSWSATSRSSRTCKPPFPRITYTEAVEVLQKAGHPMKWGDDFGGDEETVLASAYDRPVMVHRYPAAMKAFYFKKDPDDPKVALGCDVLAPEGYGEIIGGGQREDDLATLEAAIATPRPAQGGLRVVPRPAPLRHRAARRLRHGRRALRGLGLRPAPRARDHPVRRA